MAALLLTSTLTSCVHSKWVYKNNKFHTIRQVPAENGSRTNEITTYTAKKGFTAEIEINEDNGYLLISPDEDSNNWDSTKVRKPFSLEGWRAANAGSQYYPETKHLENKDVKKFVYFDSKPQLQALTIPIKIRPKLSGYLDSFPSQAETGFNLDVAFGWKFNILNIYNGRKGIFGQATNTWSVTPGIFLGLGATSLSSANTRNPVITFDRSAPTISKGAYLMLGFNNINIGGAIGWDNATGIGGKEWLYQNKMWYGLIFGFDLLN